jgi:hypothetical protein
MQEHEHLNTEILKHFGQESSFSDPFPLPFLFLQRRNLQEFHLWELKISARRIPARHLYRVTQSRILCLGNPGILPRLVVFLANDQGNPGIHCPQCKLLVLQLNKHQMGQAGDTRPYKSKIEHHRQSTTTWKKIAYAAEASC